MPTKTTETLVVLPVYKFSTFNVKMNNGYKRVFFLLALLAHAFFANAQANKNIILARVIASHNNAG